MERTSQGLAACISGVSREERRVEDLRSPEVFLHGHSEMLKSHHNVSKST